MANRHVENRELTAPRIPDEDEGRGSSPRGPTAEPSFQTAWKGGFRSRRRRPGVPPRAARTRANEKTIGPEGVFALLSGTEASPDGVSLEGSRDSIRRLQTLVKRAGSKAERAAAG